MHLRHLFSNIFISNAILSYFADKLKTVFQFSMFRLTVFVFRRKFSMPLIYFIHFLYITLINGKCKASILGAFTVKSPYSSGAIVKFACANSSTVGLINVNGDDRLINPGNRFTHSFCRL